MEGQMSIFEFLPQTADFCTMPEAEVMDIISQRIGVRLKYDSYFNEYSAKIGKMEISAKISSYKLTHHGSMKISGNRHIGCSWQKSTEGGGSPCDSIDEAVEYFQKIIKQKVRMKS